MPTPQTTIRGVVRGGVVVPETPIRLPEGTEVNIVITPIPFTPEEQAEFDAWEKLSDEAWSQIDWGEGEIARDSG
jgi:hypothetical protein